MVSYMAGEPMERMGMDIAGEFHQSERGNKYIYVIQDYFTKYIAILAVQTIKLIPWPENW